MRIVFLFSLFLFISQGCAKKYTAKEYIEFVNKDNEYNKEKEETGYLFKCQFKPLAYVAAIEIINSSDSITKQRFEKEKESFEQGLYFNFIMASENGDEIIKEKNLYRYNEVQNFLLTRMNECFFLITPESDTIKTSIYQYTKSNGYSPDLSFIVTFPNKSISKYYYVDFVYIDKLLGLSEPVKLRFDSKTLNNTGQELIF